MYSSVYLHVLRMSVKKREPQKYGLGFPLDQPKVCRVESGDPLGNTVETRAFSLLTYAAASLSAVNIGIAAG